MLCTSLSVHTNRVPNRHSDTKHLALILAVNFDGTATWSPSNFRKTVDLTKMLGKATVENGKLDKLIEESTKTPRTCFTYLVTAYPVLWRGNSFANYVYDVAHL